VRHHDPVPSEDFGIIERLVCGPQQGLSGLTVFGKGCDPHRKRQPSDAFSLGFHLQLLGVLVQLFGSLADCLKGCFRENDDKLLPSVAACDIFGADVRCKAFGELAQHDIARM
jgi:hypothetical protein